MTNRRYADDAPTTEPPQPLLDDAEIMKRAGRLLGRLKDGADTTAILKGTLELLLDMHR